MTREPTNAFGDEITRENPTHNSESRPVALVSAPTMTAQVQWQEGSAKLQGQETFSNYTEGLLKDGSIAFGRILVRIKSYGNRPPGLAIGKAIVAMRAKPWTLKSVTLLHGGRFMVEAESWSAP